MPNSKPSIPVLAADYAELAKSIAYLALRAERRDAYVTAERLVEAIPSLINNLGERAAAELAETQMELSKALAEVPDGE
jgi:hypothetical protein